VSRTVHTDPARAAGFYRAHTSVNTPAEGDDRADLVAIAAEKTHPVVGMLRDLVRYLWRDLVCVFAFAHDPEINSVCLHLYLLIWSSAL